MKRYLLTLFLGVTLSLTGCAQPVEKSPVTIADKKAPQITPTVAKTAETQENDSNPAQEPIVDSFKEHLQDVTTLDNAISPIHFTDEQGDGEWRLQKCGGGYGFYYPVYGEDDIRVWNMPESATTEEDSVIGINVFSNKSSMQIVISNPLEFETIEEAKEHLHSFNDISNVSKCKIGIHDYPALKTERNIFIADTDTGGGPPTEPMYSQYYLVKSPEGILRIWLSSPVGGTDESWAEVEIMLRTFIIESEEDYKQKNPAVPIITKDKKLQFKDRETLSTFYTTCIMEGDHKSALAVSKNIANDNTAPKVWQSMKCNITGATDIITQDNRAVEPVFLSLEVPGDTGLPESDGKGNSIVRYIYFVKEKDYWYVDGPLHNAEPPEKWWEGKDFTWSSENYGLSDSSEVGQLLATQKEKEDFIVQWAKKCK